MFFLEMEEWRQYMKELGIQEVVENLAAKGLPTEWPARVADPHDEHVFYLQKGKPWYESKCPRYEGYYLGSNSGGVKCCGTGGLLPGVVWYKTCSKGHENCPFFRKENEDGQQSVARSGGGNPCKGCPDRYTACSDHCKKPDFIAWKAEQKMIRENRRAHYALVDYTRKQVQKNRRKNER